MATRNQCMHCATWQQACTAEAAAAVHPLRLPQPQSLPEPQSQSLAEARARMDAQHARAKQAQDEYRRLQLDFAQLQQHRRSKDVARARLLRASAGYSSWHSSALQKRKEVGLSGIHNECPHERAAPTPREPPTPLRLALQGAAARSGAGPAGCGRSATGGVATAAAGPAGP